MYDYFQYISIYHLFYYFCKKYKIIKVDYDLPVNIIQNLQKAKQILEEVDAIFITFFPRSPSHEVECIYNIAA